MWQSSKSCIRRLGFYGLTLSAQVFMGDVGALALGAMLGTIAVMTRQEIEGIHHKWSICGRSGIYAKLYGYLYKLRKNASFGAPASPFWRRRLERNPSGHPFLDYYHCLGYFRADDVKTSLILFFVNRAYIKWHLDVIFHLYLFVMVKLNML